MFEIKFKIKHKNCWTQNLYKRFNSSFVSHLTFSLRKGLSSDIVHISNKNDNEFDNIIAFLKRNKIVKKLEILSRDYNHLYLQIYTDVSRIHSIIGTIISHGGFVYKPYDIKGGREIWKINIPNKDKLNQLMESLKGFGEFKLLAIKRTTIDNSNLTQKQKIVLETALNSGYYEFPRSISAQDIAKKLRLSKATLLQHLRTAESKIIKNNYLS